MKRGDVIIVDFIGSVGGEIRKVRPAVVVTADRYLARDNRLQVVPLTSNVPRLYATEALVVVGGRASKAMANQVRTIARERVRRTIGSVTPQEMALLEDAVAVQLALYVAVRPLRRAR